MQRTNEERISEGTISYSKELGWINWTHAIPTNTRKAWLSFQEKNASCDSVFKFNYTQRMGFDCVFFQVYAVEGQQYLVKKIQAGSLQQIVFFEIFKSVSNSFEEMQGRFPHTLVSFRSQSDFRQGDLMGNLVSFHLSVNNISLKDFKSNLTLESKVVALKRYKKKKLKKIHWSDIEKHKFEIFSSYLNKEKINEKKYCKLIDSSFEYEM